MDEDVKQRLPAVFRRMHREAHLSWMSVQGVARFFRQLLLRFLPGCSPLDWEHSEQEFLNEAAPWRTRPISVDMVKQFPMRQITEATCLGPGCFVPSGQPGMAEFRVHALRYSGSFALVCNAESANSFPDAYSPVHHAAAKQ